MLDVSGRYRIRYGDIFRAVGHFLDESLFRDLTMVETQDGFVVKGGIIRTGGTSTGFVPQSYLFADNDLETLLDQAFERRGADQSAAASLPSFEIDGERVRYEDALRSIGMFVDRIGWHEIVLVQTSKGFHLKGVSKDAPIDRTIDATVLKELLGEMDKGRDYRENPREISRRRLWPR